MNKNLFAPIAFVTALVLLAGSLLLISYTRKTAPAPSIVLDVTTKTFDDEVLNSKIPVYVLFYVKKGCQPCEDQKPIVEKLAAEFAGKVKFVKVEALDNEDVSIAAGIQAVPTHFFLKPAEMVGMGAQGYLSEGDLRKFIEAGLAKKAKPAAPAQPGAQPGTGQPAKPADPAKPAGPATPAVDPAKPADPVMPDPVEPDPDNATDGN